MSRHQSCSQLPVETATVVCSSDEDDSLDASSAEECVTVVMEQQPSNVASGLFVRTSRPLPLSVSRSIPWPRLWGRRRLSLSMEHGDFVTRLDDPSSSTTGSHRARMACYFRSSDVETISTNNNNKITKGCPNSSIHLARRCSTG